MIANIWLRTVLLLFVLVGGLIGCRREPGGNSNCRANQSLPARTVDLWGGRHEVRGQHSIQPLSRVQPVSVIANKAVSVCHQPART